MRLDKYLKVSRIIKRRPVAKEVADKGRIKVNGILAKSSTDFPKSRNLFSSEHQKRLRLNLAAHQFEPLDLSLI